ncbi:hypothetical protein FM038_003550 [Shewanella eurypsychrophilus]|uniref:Porin domain-containing protein n=1 Tax=Shewanella eurypsychrophilus TaxID=2593656 RepID=A0ABX6V1Y2_9GAMM|nr:MULTISPECIES: hypothetical protein [Shewanella]QFU21311.1 hypothetical protein FS418_05130 [Shewanella sp. YLB-09]QPG56602.1 hypothetical protein FM038_003550 [Shewanella eurypsychrophilus]
MPEKITKKLDGNLDNTSNILLWIKGGITVLVVIHLCVMSQVQARTHDHHEQSEFNLNFSGFGTLGVVRSFSDELLFHRELSMNASDSEYSFKPDSLLGLQVNADFSESLDGIAQVVLKDRTSDLILDSLELMFLRYRPNRDWSIRLGRTSTDLYMLSEYRNVSYAYLWSRPIPEFYTLTSTVSKIDGIDISYTHELGGGSWETKLAYGITHSLLAVQTGRFDVDLKNVVALTSIYTWEDWIFRLAAASVEVDELDFMTNDLVTGLNLVPATLWPEARVLAQELDGPGQKLQYYALGLQYDHMNWIIQSELGYIDSDWGMLQSFYNGYLSVGYRVDEMTFYSVLAYIDNSEEPAHYVSPQLPKGLPIEVAGQINALYEGAVEAFSAGQVEQTTFSLGLRWDLYPNTCVKFQWDHSWVDPSATAMWTQTLELFEDAEVDLLSLNFSFIFSL